VLLTDSAGGLVGATTASTSSGILGSGITASEVAAGAAGVSALHTMLQGRPCISIPPTPGLATQDQTVLNAQQQELAREQAAGGLQSTTGTPGGQAGAMLNPSTTSNRSILGG
jgi:hypothetical protein